MLAHFLSVDNATIMLLNSTWQSMLEVRSDDMLLSTTIFVPNCTFSPVMSGKSRVKHSS